MIYEENFKIGLKDIGKNNLIKNKAILEMLENIGAFQSDLVGYGINDIIKNKITWILLDFLHIEILKYMLKINLLQLQHLSGH